MIPIEELEFYFRWWNCVTLPYKVQLEFCIQQFRTMVGFTPRVLFDGLWVEMGGTVDSFEYKMFLLLYPLVLHTQPIEGGADIEVYEFLGFWWFSFSAFGDTDGYLHPDPCLIFSYSTT